MKQSDLEKVYREHAPDVYKVAYGITKNPQTAEDITQEVFYKVLLNLKDIRENEVGAWLSKVAKNTALDYYRKVVRNREMPIEDVTVRSVGYKVSNRLERKELLREEREFRNKVMDALFERDREWYLIIYEIEIKGRSQDEVAAELEISKNTLRVKLHRAKKWIRTMYRKEARDSGYL